MNSLLPIYMFIILIISVLFLFIFIIVFFLIDSNEKVSSKDKNLINFKDLILPEKITNFEDKELKDITNKIYDLYIKCGFKNKNISDLYLLEWHSWQVSILLQSLKSRDIIKTENRKKDINEFFFKMSDNEIIEKINLIIYKYKKSVNIKGDRDTLSKDYIWNSYEVSLIIFKLTKDI